MKVLFISEYYPPRAKGGGEISVELLAKKLIKENIEIHVLTSMFSGLKKEEIINGVNIHRFLKTGESPTSLLGNYRRSIFFQQSLKRELPKIAKKFDVIHCFNTTSVISINQRNQVNKPFILHVNSPVLFCPKGTLMYKDKVTCNLKCTRKTYLRCYASSKLIGKMEINPLIKYNPGFVIALRQSYEARLNSLRKFDYYLPISNYMKERLLLAGIPESKIKIIYNIIEVDNFKKLKKPKRGFVKILYLGEYSRIKGPQILLEALKKINVPFEANFYGEGILKGYLEQQAKLTHSVNIHRKIKYKEIPSVLEMHNIVVFPSLVGEALGRVLLEAIAAKRTVIASKVGGVTDIIQDGKSGYLYDGTVQGLVLALNKAMKVPINPIIEDKFNSKYVVSEVKKIYEKFI